MPAEAGVPSLRRAMCRSEERRCVSARHARRPERAKPEAGICAIAAAAFVVSAGGSRSGWAGRRRRSFRGFRGSRWRNCGMGWRPCGQAATIESRTDRQKALEAIADDAALLGAGSGRGFVPARVVMRCGGGGGRRRRSG